MSLSDQTQLNLNTEESSTEPAAAGPRKIVMTRAFILGNKDYATPHKGRYAVAAMTTDMGRKGGPTVLVDRMRALGLHPEKMLQSADPKTIRQVYTLDLDESVMFFNAFNVSNDSKFCKKFDKFTEKAAKIEAQKLAMREFARPVAPATTAESASEVALDSDQIDAMIALVEAIQRLDERESYTVYAVSGKQFRLDTRRSDVYGAAA